MKKFKSSILKILIIGGIGIQTFSCMSDIDMPPKTYADFAELHGLSSSSIEASSSSSMEIEASSSSVELSSSSSDEVSSSSVGVSSSSIEVEVSSSSVESSLSSSSSNEEISSSSHSCIDKFPSSTHFCYGGKVYEKCDRKEVTYNPETHICDGDIAKFVECNGVNYNPLLQFCDARDSKIYKWVKIGDQIWMAENLNYDVQNNTTDVCYDNDADNCVMFGRLYNWATAMSIDAVYNSSNYTTLTNHKGICPEGWHISNSAEWDVLTNFVGTSSSIKLRGWNINGNGTDNYGFSALLGGNGESDGSFYSVGNYGGWWSTNETSSYHALSWLMSFFNADAYAYEFDKSYLFSLRCLKDQ